MYGLVFTILDLVNVNTTVSVLSCHIVSVPTFVPALQTLSVSVAGVSRLMTAATVFA